MSNEEKLFESFIFQKFVQDFDGYVERYAQPNNPSTDSFFLDW